MLSTRTKKNNKLIFTQLPIFELTLKKKKPKSLNSQTVAAYGKA